MRKNIKWGLLAALAGAGIAVPVRADYIIHTLTSFNGTDGMAPVNGVVLYNETLYGTAANTGTVFSVPVTGSLPVTLASLGVGDGNFASDLVVDSAGNLFTVGASPAPNPVYEIPANGISAVQLGTLTGPGLYGEANPSGLAYGNGTVYGSTMDGGSNPSGYPTYGAVYSLPFAFGQPNVLAEFSSSEKDPKNIIVSNGSVLGIAKDSSNLYKYIFSIQGGTLTNVLNLEGTNNQINDLIASDGTNLYGEYIDGTTGNDYAFSMPDAGGPITLLGLLPDNGLGGLTEANGMLYFSFQSNNDFGFIMSLPTSGGTPQLLATFDGADGNNPQGDLAVDSNGDLFGTAPLGGAYGDGTVFELSPTAVPEPTGLSLLAVGGAALLRWRRITKS